jgi:hypothetical protein
MAMDLRSESGTEFRVSGTGWAFYLNLAELYGWMPKGTNRPKDYPVFKIWPGAYDRNEGQVVSKEDALELGLALDRAAADPQLHTRSTQLAEQLTQSLQRATGITSLRVDAPDDHAQFMHDLASFCMEGSFVIA